MTEKHVRVGYGSPPRATRFRKGESGNPRGRPKGARNLATEFADALKGEITVVENGRRKVMTRQKALIKGLVNDALKGDPRARGLVLQLVSGFEMNGALTPSDLELSKSDQQILDRALTRMSRRLMIKNKEPPK